MTETDELRQDLRERGFDFDEFGRSCTRISTRYGDIEILETNGRFSAHFLTRQQALVMAVMLA